MRNEIIQIVACDSYHDFEFHIFTKICFIILKII
jgi:hypothetical protein